MIALFAAIALGPAAFSGDLKAELDRDAVWLHNLRPKLAHPEILASAITATKDVETGDEEAKARAEARLAEAFRRAREPLLQWAQNPGPFDHVDSAREDFVKPMPGGRYFVHADGRPLIPIGYNHNPDWTELEYANPLNPDYNPSRTDAWFANLQVHGVNVIRMMAETPQSGNLEDRPGLFSPEHLIWLDNIFRDAQRHRIKLWITPYDTFWMNLRKEASPYWAVNGGPIRKPIDFLTRPEIVRLQERRMKLLIDRYGESGTVFAWELMNEIDLWWGASPQQIKAWIDQVSPYVHRYEAARWRRNHMVTMSFGEPEPAGQNAETAFRRPDFDFATMHLYLGATRAPGPKDAEKAGEDFAAGVRYARSQIRDNRPVLDGESGPIDHWIADEKLDDAVFHQMSWQHLMNGGAGSGTRWPYRNPHHLTPGMLDTLRKMSVFCAGVDWRRLNGEEVKPPPQPDHSVVCFEAEGGDMIAWARDGATRIALPGNAKTVGVFDVGRGVWINPSELVRADTLTLPTGVTEAAVYARSR